jgi:transposase
MRTCSHDERLLGRPQMEDSLRRGRRMPKAQAARTFSVSLSSVKRYVEKAQRGESLAPKKRPGSAPKLDEKAMKLLEEDLEERPYLTLQERRDYVEAVSGISVSRSTMCRAIARIGPTRKKGGDQPPSATSS